MQVGRATAGAAPGVGALFAASLAMRPQLVGLGPLLPRITDELGLSHWVSGLLVTLPVLCMGVLTPLGARVARRTGALRGAALCMAAIGLFGLLRAVAPDIGVARITVAAALCLGIRSVDDALYTR